MPAIHAPAWPTPLDGVHTTTSDDQEETEEAIHALFASLRPSHYNFVPAPEQESAIVNPWLSEAEQEQQRKASSSASKPRATLVLERQAHISFLTKLLDPLPGAYTAFDTNRSWLLYWILHSFDLLSTGLDPRGRARAISTLLSFQNTVTGGFGGGPNQIAHLMSTYAAISALAIVGGPGPSPTKQDIESGKSVEVGKGGWDAIDKRKMYDWIMSLKQPDGSFLVHENGEVDVRASYCVICITSLLGISTPELVRGMGEFISSCQTYEGGLSASSQPTYTYSDSRVPSLPSLDVSRPALGEAHGGYAFCGLATHLALCLYPDCGPGSILPGLPISSSTIRQKRNDSAGEFDMDSLIRWASSQQGIPVEGCGFRGRTNKLVDGCYGWFSGGGLFSVLSAVLENDLLLQHQKVDDFNGLLTLPIMPEIVLPSNQASQAPTSSASVTSDHSGSWKTESSTDAAAGSAPGLSEDEQEDDLSPLTLYDRRGLQEYILIAAQRRGAEGGGLRDKPGKKPDAYHTCYNLSGLALSQHSVRLSPETKKYLLDNYKATPTPEHGDVIGRVNKTNQDWRKDVYASMLSWTLSARDELIVAEDTKDQATNRLNPTHPIFNITFPRAKAMMDWAYGQM